MGAAAGGDLATMATIIASQAVITGAYSLTQQAVIAHAARMKIRTPRTNIRARSTCRGEPLADDRSSGAGHHLRLVLETPCGGLRDQRVTGTMVITALLGPWSWPTKHWKMPIWAAVAMMAPGSGCWT